MNAVTPEDWLEITRYRLYDTWVATTGHAPDANRGTWACEIALGCRTCDEHLSLPCSLLAEANEIGLFLSTPCFTARPRSFFRFYLILLSEFVNQLRGLSHSLGLEIGKPPKLVVVWANCWAKHRLHILVQHHPEPIFADEYGEKWLEMERALPGSLYEDNRGKQRPVMLINTAWLCDEANGHEPNLELANGEAKAVIVFPPMQDFLDQTCGYFRHFIDATLKAPSVVRKLQSDHVTIRC
jgi:hypothetical protein